MTVASAEARGDLGAPSNAEAPVVLARKAPPGGDHQAAAVQGGLDKLQLKGSSEGAPAPQQAQPPGGRPRQRGSRRGGGGGAAAKDASRPGLPPAPYMQGSPMGFAPFPFGQQLFYYLPVQRGGGPGGPGAGAGGQSGQLGPHGLVPYAFPPAPYSSPLHPPMGSPMTPLPVATAPGGRRQPLAGGAGNGWGGVPLGSQAGHGGAGFSGPHRLGPPSAAAATYRMGGSSARSAGPAARTLPLPPRKPGGGSGEGGAGPAGVPHSPAQADRPARTPLAGSSLSSSASSDGEGQPARAGSAASAASSSMDAAASASAAEQQQGAGPAAAGGEEGEAAAEEAGGSNGAAASPREPAAQQGRGGAREHGERQPCAFFLKTGTCAYGDRWVQRCTAAFRSEELGAPGPPRPCMRPGGGGRAEPPCRAQSRVAQQELTRRLGPPSAPPSPPARSAANRRCKFEHPYELAPHVEFNSLGLPLRPSEPECSYYMKYKT